MVHENCVRRPLEKILPTPMSMMSACGGPFPTHVYFPSCRGKVTPCFNKMDCCWKTDNAWLRSMPVSTHSVLWLTERYHQHVQVKDTIKKRWHAIDNDVHVATHESSNYSPPLVYVIHVLSWPHSSRPAKFLVRSDLSCMNILKKSFVLLAQAVRWGLQFWKMSDFY